ISLKRRSLVGGAAGSAIAQTDCASRVEKLIVESRLARDRVGPKGSAQDAGKVAADHRRGGYGVQPAKSQVLENPARCLQAGALVVAKDEELVLDDRPADRGAELVLLHRRSWKLGPVVLPAVRVEIGVLKKLEQNAMYPIGTRFELYIHHASGGAAVFGVIAIRQDVQLTDGLDGGTDHE